MTRVEIDVIVFGEGVNFLLIGASDYDALVLLTTGMAAVEIMVPRPAAVEGDEAGRHLIVVSRNFIVRLVGPLGRNYLSIAGAGRLSNLQYSRYCFPDRTK